MIFKRGMIDRERNQVGVETDEGIYFLSNPTPDGRVYDPDKVLASVAKAGTFDPTLWTRVAEPRRRP